MFLILPHTKQQPAGTPVTLPALETLCVSAVACTDVFKCVIETVIQKKKEREKKLHKVSDGGKD